MDPHQKLNADLPAGTQVGEYEVQSKLGEGGFGAVFRAVHPLIGKEAAIKVLNQEFSVNPEMVQRFISEARAVNQIRHRNIIDIFSFGRLEDGRCYYVMELLEGHTLDEYMNRSGRDTGEALSILRSVARALDAAHAKGIAHRDLKPENIFVGSDAEGKPFPKLLDFGIAKLLSEEGEKQYKTRTGAPMGTPAYMSPEQCRGKAVDHRTDIYAFGIMTYELLAGRRPFDGESFMDIMFKQMSEAAPPPSTLGLHPAFDAPILWMLNKEPGDRPPDLKTAVDSLEDAARAAGFSVTTAMNAAARLPTATPVPVFGIDPTLLGTGGQVTPGAPPVSPTIADRTFPPATRSRVPVVLGALVAIGLAAGAVVFLRGAPPPPVTTAPPPAIPDPKPGASVNTEPSIVAPPGEDDPVPGSTAPAPVPLPATVKLSIIGTPKGMLVVGADGAELGRAPGEIELPRGDQPVSLQLSADGFRTATREVLPNADGTLEVRLEKERASKRPPDGGPDRPKRPDKDALENPF